MIDSDCIGHPACGYLSLRGGSRRHSGERIAAQRLGFHVAEHRHDVTDNLPIRKRLFLTATPRHYDLKRSDAEDEPIEVYSMNRPEIYGPVVHTLSFAEAAKQKFICNDKVVISVVTSAMLDQQQLRHGIVLISDSTRRGFRDPRRARATRTGS